MRALHLLIIQSAVRKQVLLTAPLYSRRSKTISQIPNFWPLVLEQAPPDIDQYIQPSDSALLLSSLQNLSVSHFEIDSEDGSRGDPRSVSIRFEFAENEYFEDTVLEKKFWHRRSRDGWSGLVSEPVPIKWKKDRDLTGGLLDMVVKAWEADRAASKSMGSGVVKSKGGLSPEQKALKKKIENTGMGGLSFFAWFGFIGRHVSAEESAAATALERQKRAQREARKTNKRKSMERSRSSTPSSDGEEEAAGSEGSDDDVGMSLEIFPDGDDLAVAFTEDLWPGAIKYFSKPLTSLFHAFPLLDIANSSQHKHKNKTPYPTQISSPTTTKTCMIQRTTRKTRTSGRRRRSSGLNRGTYQRKTIR